MQHELKIELPYANAIYRGDRNFEVRYNDRGYQKGDTIVFIPIEENGITCFHHKLYQAQYTITYVHSGLGLKEGYVILGIQETSAYEKFLKEQEEQQNYEEAIRILKEKFGIVTPDNADS